MLLCTAELWDLVVLLGSEGGQALLLLNSSLVCRLILDHEFGCIALAGCHVLQLSLQQYQDDQLPDSPGPLITCSFVNPLLFTLTASGIICILNPCLRYPLNSCKFQTTYKIIFTLSFFNIILQSYAMSVMVLA